MVFNTITDLIVNKKMKHGINMKEIKEKLLKDRLALLAGIRLAELEKVRFVSIIGYFPGN